MRSFKWKIATPTLILLFCKASLGEVSLDGTVGPKASLEGPDYTIPHTVGSTAGTNLFHSFSQFNIAPKESATFTGPAGLENVISRVTGGDPSNIDGLLRSIIPGADFWFINPSGVFFGPGAQVDVPASFHVSSADKIRFDDDAVFSATAPNTSRLSVASPEAFGFLTEDPKEISIQDSKLDVREGDTFSVIGGDITMEGGLINAPSGRINVASVASPGEVAVTTNHLTTDAGGRINIHEAQVTTSGPRGGHINIRGGEITVTQSNILSDNTGSQDASGGVNIHGDKVSVAAGVVRADAFGKGHGGTINVKANKLELSDSAFLSSSTFGPGHAGRVIVQADQVHVFGDDKNSSGIVSDVFPDATGQEGEVNITASLLDIRQRGQIRSLSRGNGHAGVVNVSADVVQIRDSGQIIVSTTAAGNAGTVKLKADRIAISGEGINTGIVARTNANSTGKSGSVSIIADTLDVSGEGGILASTISTRRGGTITVKAGTVQVYSGGQITSNTHSAGDAGTITVDADRLIVNGSSPNPTSVDGIIAQADRHSSGNAGTVTIKAGSLEVGKDGKISTIALGTGEAGRIAIVADAADIHNAGRITSDTSGGGEGGNIDITAGTLEVHDHGEISIDAFPLSTSSGGKVIISADSIEVYNSGQISSETTGAGQGGDIDITADTIEVHYGGEISASTSGVAGIGAGGNIHVAAGILEVRRSGKISSDTAGLGKAGTVDITADTLEVRYGGKITSEALGASEGDGGAVRVQADKILISAESGQNTGILSRARSASRGNAGDVIVKAESLEILDRGRITSSTFAPGKAGEVIVDATRLYISGNGAIGFTGIASQANKGTGHGGTVSVTADSLQILDGGDISASTFADGNAGNLNVDATRLYISGNGAIGFTGIASQANVGAGHGGSVSVTADTLEIGAQGNISTSTSAAGNAGDVSVDATEVRISGNGAAGFTGIASQANVGSTGNGGSVSVTADTLEIGTQGDISTSTFAAGKAGNVSVDATRLYISGNGAAGFTGIASQANVGSTGNGGSVSVTADTLEIGAQGNISTSTFAAGKAGDVRVDATEVRISGNGAAGFTGIASQVDVRSTGDGGSVNVIADLLDIHNGGKIATSTFGSGKGGNVSVQSDTIELSDLGEVTAVSTSTKNAGNISIVANDTIRLSNNSRVTTEATRASGGNIELKAPSFIELIDSQVESSVFGPPGTKGGDINIDPRFLILDGSNILAKAKEGRGGNINVVADYIIRSAGSEINAQAGPTGIDGTVVLSTPEIDLQKGLVELPVAFFDVASQVRGSCEARRSVGESAFTEVGRGGLPPELGAGMPAFYTLGADGNETIDAHDGKTTEYEGLFATPAAGVALVCGDLR